MQGNSLIDLSNLSKPATELIKKVSAAIGAIYAPTHPKRMARAEAEAEKIKAIAGMELTDIERRGLERFIYQEARKQENIEKITAEAASLITNEARVESLEEDWIAHFFKKCDTVSDKEMQSLWARVLSGESAQPGSFSTRTVDFISILSKKDADFFTKLCQFVWTIGDPTPLVYSFKDEIYAKSGISFEVLTHLDAIGLISFNLLSGYYKGSFIKYGNASYYGRCINIEFSSYSNDKLKIGQVLFTAIGKELFPICGSSPNDDFYYYVIDKWFRSGLILSSTISHARKP